MVKKMNQIYYEYKRKLLHLFIFTFVLLIIGLFVFFYVFDQIFNGLLVDAFLILNININQVYDAFLFLIMIAAGMIWLIFMIKNYQQAILEINDLSDEKTPEKQIQELEKIAQDIEALMTRYKHLQEIQDREMHQKEELIQSLNDHLQLPLYHLKQIITMLKDEAYQPVQDQLKNQGLILSEGIQEMILQIFEIASIELSDEKKNSEHISLTFYIQELYTAVFHQPIPELENITLTAPSLYLKHMLEDCYENLSYYTNQLQIQVTKKDQLILLHLEAKGKEISEASFSAMQKQLKRKWDQTMGFLYVKSLAKAINCDFQMYYLSHSLHIKFQFHQ